MAPNSYLKCFPLAFNSKLCSECFWRKHTQTVLSFSPASVSQCPCSSGRIFVWWVPSRSPHFLSLSSGNWSQHLLSSLPCQVPPRHCGVDGLWIPATEIYFLTTNYEDCLTHISENRSVSCEISGWILGQHL